MANPNMLMLEPGHTDLEIAEVDAYNLMDRTAIKAMSIVLDN